MNDHRLIKPEAKRLFLLGKDGGDIRKIFPQIPESTLYNWINREKWKELRDSKMQKYTKTPEILLDTLERMINSLDAQLGDPNKVAKAADSICKIVKSIKSLSKEKDRLSSVIFAVDELGQFMNYSPDKHIFDDEFRVKFDKLLSGFQQRMLEKYSPKNMN